MASVATEYPARTDDNGVTWYRPARDKGTTLSQWGWTNNPKLAHPDYIRHPNKKMPMGRLELLMDKRRKTLEEIVVRDGTTTTNPAWVKERGRYEGVAACLAILRGTSIQTEIVRSDTRLGIS